MLEKNQVRKTGHQNLQALTDAQQAQLMQEMTQRITQLPQWINSEHIALTMSQAGELPTGLLLQTAMLQGKQIYLPRVLPGHQLEFVPVDQSTAYQQNEYGILEPIGMPLTDVKKIELVIVPGFVYAENGHRIGFGGGYYDRFLKRCPQLNTLGVAWAKNFVTEPTWPVEETDAPVNQVIVVGETVG